MVIVIDPSANERQLAELQQEIEQLRYVTLNSLGQQRISLPVNRIDIDTPIDQRDHRPRIVTNQRLLEVFVGAGKSQNRKQYRKQENIASLYHLEAPGLAMENSLKKLSVVAAARVA